MLCTNGAILVNGAWSVGYYREISGRRDLALFSGAFALNLAASAIIAEARLKVPVPPATRADGRRRPARLAAPTWVPHSEIAEAYNSCHQQMRVNAAQDFLVQPAQI